MEKRYIGIDLGGTKIAAGLVDDNGNILKKVSTPTLAYRPAEEIVDDMARLVKELCGEFSLSPSDIEFLGVGTPGIANTETGCVDFCSSLPFVRYPLVSVLKEKTGIADVDIENDANAAAKAEQVAGAAKGARDAVMITLGTGVGGGVIINNKIYSGCNFSAGELGHIVIQKDGRECKCGRKGCWETYSSATGLILTTREKMAIRRDSMMWTLCDNDLDKVNGRTAFTAMRAGDEAAKDVVDEYVDYLVCGLVNIINIFEPEVLVIGGGISGEGDKLLDLILAPALRQRYSARSEKRTEIKIATLGNNAGIIGAAYLRK